MLDVPEPACKPGGVLVRSLYSLISTGTELMKVTEARLSLLGKARARPDQVQEGARLDGPAGAGRHLQEGHDQARQLHPAGLLAVRRGRRGRRRRRGVRRRRPRRGGRQRVRAARRGQLGARQPLRAGARGRRAGARRLRDRRRHRHAGRPSRASRSSARWPASSASGWSASSSCGCSSPPGCGSSASTPSTERCRLAEAAGAHELRRRRTTRAPPTSSRCIRTATGGLGADHVFLAAGGDTNGPVELAARLARDRARVVDIGKTRLDLPWNAYYEKELDVRFSRSYGPGRYDDRYELEGIDYPAGLRALDRATQPRVLPRPRSPTGSVEVGSLVSGTRPVADAAEVYEQLRTGSLRGVGFLFEYPRARAAPTTTATAPRAAGGSGRPVASTRRPARPATPTVRLGFIGAGSYASSMLLPHLAKHPGATLGHGRHDHGRCRPSTPSARSASRRPRPTPTPSSTTRRIDAVFVVTRHHSHADFVCRALEARQGRLRREAPGPHSSGGRRHPRRRRAHRERPAHGRLQPALRPAARRHAPALRHGWQAPVSARYLVNAGRLDAGELVPRRAARGVAVPRRGRPLHRHRQRVGRAPPRSRSAPRQTPTGPTCTSRSASPTARWRRSPTPPTATAAFPKETLDVSGGGRNARLDNFARATVWTRGRAGASSGPSPARTRASGPSCDAFLEAVRLGAADADRPRLARRHDPGDDRRRREPAPRAGRWLREPVGPAGTPGASAGCPRSEVDSRGSATGCDRSGGPSGRCVPETRSRRCPACSRPGCSRARSRTGARAQVPPRGRATARRRRRPAARR